MTLEKKIKINPTIELSKKELLSLSLIFVLIGIISNIKPLYSLLILSISATLLITILHPKQAFLGAGIFLIFQEVITRNMINLGGPENLVNIIKRVDEFVWIFFLIFVVLYNYKNKTWKLKRTNLDKTFLALVSIGILSTVVNHNSLIWSSIAISLALKPYIMYWLALNLNLKWENIKFFFEILVYILTLAAFIGIFQLLKVPFTSFGFSERLGVSVSHSFFGHHVTFGTLMATGCAITIGLTLGTNQKKWLFFSTILFIGLISSSLRSSLIGLLIGIIWVLINFKKFKISKKIIYLSIIILALGIFIFGNRFITLTKGTTMEYGTFNTPRYWLYYGGYKIFQKKPLLGEGPGKYGSFISVITKSEIYKKYNIPIYDDDTKTDTYWPYILGEYGILGVLIIIATLTTLIYHLYKNFPNEKERKFLKGLYIGYNILFMKYLAESLVQQVYKNSLFAFILFAGIGMIISVNNNTINKTKEYK